MLQLKKLRTTFDLDAAWKMIQEMDKAISIKKGTSPAQREYLTSLRQSAVATAKGHIATEWKDSLVKAVHIALEANANAGKVNMGHGTAMRPVVVNITRDILPLAAPKVKFHGLAGMQDFRAISSDFEQRGNGLVAIIGETLRTHPAIGAVAEALPASMPCGSRARCVLALCVLQRRCTRVWGLREQLFSEVCAISFFRGHPGQSSTSTG